MIKNKNLLSTKISSTNLSKGSFQDKLPCVWVALENSLASVPVDLHQHDPVLVLLDAELTKPPVIPPDLQLILKSSQEFLCCSECHSSYL